MLDNPAILRIRSTTDISDQREKRVALGRFVVYLSLPTKGRGSEKFQEVNLQSRQFNSGVPNDLENSIRNFGFGRFHTAA